MDGQEKFNKLLAKYPPPNQLFFERPHLSRRRFFEIVGAGVTCGARIGRGSAEANASVRGAAVFVGASRT